MAQRSKPAFLPHSLLRAFCAVLAPRSLLSGVPDGVMGPSGAGRFPFFCGDERYVALTWIGDLAKRNFAEKHHIIWNVPPVWSLYWHWSSLHLQPQCFAVRVRRWRRNSRNCF